MTKPTTITISVADYEALKQMATKAESRRNMSFRCHTLDSTYKDGKGVDRKGSGIVSLHGVHAAFPLNAYAIQWAKLLDKRVELATQLRGLVESTDKATMPSFRTDAEKNETIEILDRLIESANVTSDYSKAD